MDFAHPLLSVIGPACLPIRSLLDDSVYSSSSGGHCSEYGHWFLDVSGVIPPRFHFGCGKAYEYRLLSFLDCLWPSVAFRLLADRGSFSCCFCAVLGGLLPSGWWSVGRDACFCRDCSCDFAATPCWVFAFLFGCEFPSIFGLVPADSPFLVFPCLVRALFS